MRLASSMLVAPGLAALVALAVSPTIPAAALSQTGGSTAQIARQFAARDFVVRAEDLELTLHDGSIFPVETPQGIAALVLIGRGTMRFTPAPAAEQTQVRIFSGSTTLESRFETALVWFGRLDGHADLSGLASSPVAERDRQRAQEVLIAESSKTLVSTGGPEMAHQPGARGIDRPGAVPRLTPLPDPADVVAEVRTRRFGALTYLRSAAAPEDITLFDRAAQKTIALYPSASRLAARGRVYREDETAEFDVLHHDLDLSFDPARRWIEGRADMRLRVRAAGLQRLTLRFSEALAIASISSPDLGPLNGTRVGSRDALLVDLPAPVAPATELTLSIHYSGRIDPPAPEWELPRLPGDVPTAPFQIAYLNSTYPAWYPRSPIIDYATARMKISVPAAFDCIASGEVTTDTPGPSANASSPGRKQFLFAANRPLPHLAFLVTPLAVVGRQSLGGGSPAPLSLTVMAHPGLAPGAEARDFAASSAAIVRFYESLLGDFPYTSLTTARLEGEIPGGHSVGHFSAIGWPPKNTARSWKDDPAAFDLVPDFLLAHEIAHQWWGHAVGWNVYHDQWMNEALAQYFAALFVEKEHGADAFRGVLRRMRAFAIDKTGEGPLTLGYRLGSLSKDDSAFRAILSDKGPAVLHMLRRFVGDEAFFGGLRRFYAAQRFRKPATDDLRAAMESAAGRPLQRFFDRWVYGSTLPQVRVTSRVEPAVSDRALVVRIDQIGELFDVPIAVTVQYADRPPQALVIPVSDRSTEIRIPLTGAFRRLEIRPEDDGGLVKTR